MKIFLTIAALLFLLYIGIRVVELNNRVSSDSPKYVALREVKVDEQWNRSGFGTVMMVDLKVKNPTPYAFKDFDVECSTYGASGTKIESLTKTIYQVVPAKSTKSIKQVNMGFISKQAATAGCEITDLAVADK